MPYNSETETFYQAPATVVDSTPDGDTVQEGFDDRLTPALAGVYADFNLLKADGMISVGIPATTTARGIGRVATSADLVDGATINNGPAFVAAGENATTTPAANTIPVSDANGRIASGWLLFAAPTGLTAWWPGSTPPDGWLEEDGSFLNKVTYAKLFAVLGTRFGGDANNFALCDMRGISKKAWDHGRGVDPGRGLGTYQDDAMRNATGSFKLNTASITSTAGVFVRSGNADGNWMQTTGNSGLQTEAFFSLSPSVPTAIDTRVKNMSYMSIIKY